VRREEKGSRLFKIGSGRHLRTVILIAVAIGVTALALTAYAVALLESLEGSTVNTRFSIRGHQKTPNNVVLVKIDDKTFQDLDQQWPLPRATDARVISNISKQRPAAIAFDVQFSEQSQLGQSDEEALLEAVQGSHGKTVFSFTEPNANGDVRFLGSGQGTKLLGLVGSRPANGLFPPDPGNIERRMAYSIDGLRTLAVVTAEVATHKKVSPAQFDGGTNWIDYVGPSGSFPSVSFSQVYSAKFGAVPKDFFRGKIVVIGATAPSLQDIHATSTDSLMPGPEVQANAIDTVLRGFPLHSVPRWVNVLLIVLMGFAVPLASLRLGPIAATLLALALGAAFVVGCQLAFNSGWVVQVVYPLGALILSAGLSLAAQLVTEAFERIRVRDLFARFVPENVVDQVLESADGLRLGGVQREGTVMFSDVRGFTTLAESLSPAQVIDLLNHYLSEMSDAILDHGGTLVAYMGDGIFAVFGAPLAMDDHADRALAAAREMLDVRLPRFNEWLRNEGLSEGVRMGIGLNSGNVMSGHVGSERRVEYAAVGDTTNTASRIEAMTKGTPHQLLISESTKDALRSPAGDLVFVSETDIRGREGRIKLWSITEQGPGPSTPEAAPLQAAAPEV